MPLCFLMPPARVNVLLNDPSLTWPEKLTLRTYFGSKSSATVTSDQFSQRHDCASRTAICSAVTLRKVFIFYVYYCDNLNLAANIRNRNLIAIFSDVLQVGWKECRNHHCSDSRSLRFRSIISPSVFPKYPPIFPSERMTLWQGTSGANGFFLNA